MENNIDDFEFDEFEEIERLEKKVKFVEQIITDFVRDNGLERSFINWLSKQEDQEIEQYIGDFVILMSKE